jgi:uncharacterized protein
MGSSRPKAALHVVAYCLAFLPIWLVVPLVDDIVEMVAPVWLGTIVQAGFYLGGVVAVTWAFCRFLHRGSLTDVGLHRQGWVQNLFGGWAIGASLVGLTFVIYAAAGWLSVEGMTSDIRGFIIVGLSWIASSTVEEITTRGYIMQRLALAWGMPVAIVVASVIFTMPHALNPNVTVLALSNTFLIGVFFALAYLVTRSLWLPIGLHIGWNLAEIGLGFPDSGLVEPGLIRSTVQGPSLITGGAYGPEAGLVVSTVTLLGIVAMMFLRRRKALAGSAIED